MIDQETELWEREGTLRIVERDRELKKKNVSDGKIIEVEFVDLLLKYGIDARLGTHKEDTKDKIDVIFTYQGKRFVTDVKDQVFLCDGHGNDNSCNRVEFQKYCPNSPNNYRLGWIFSPVPYITFKEPKCFRVVDREKLLRIANEKKPPKGSGSLFKNAKKTFWEDEVPAYAYYRTNKCYNDILMKVTNLDLIECTVCVFYR